QISPKFTEETLLTILKRATGSDSIKLIKYEVSGDTTRGGDSYLSTLVRMKIEGLIDNKSYPVSIVIKTLPKNIGRRKTFRSCDFFKNEVSFYNEVLQKFMVFQNEKKPKNPFYEIPRCLYALADGENDFIALEDVSIHGFESGDRMEGVNFDHCAAVLKTLGRFHALSLAVKDQDPEGFKIISSKVKETYWHEDFKSWYYGQFEKFKKICLEAVSKEYPNSVYEEKFKHFADDTLYDQLSELAKAKTPYAVIGHGDTWAPNFMFTYTDEQKKCIKDIRMIDFQLARYGSPINDLSFYIFSCTTQEFRCSHFKELMKVYYSSVSEFLQDLGSSPDDVFSHEAFEKEMLTYMKFGLGFSLESVPFSLMDESEASNLDLIEGNEAVPIEKVWNVAPLKTKEARLRIADNFKFAVDNGYL
ncbi:hypothetical protein L9F63_023004, partial [Diploptera punctata]